MGYCLLLTAVAAALARAGGAKSGATRIHIGSCSDTHEPQPLWNVLEKRNADAFFWGGDVVRAPRPRSAVCRGYGAPVPSSYTLALIAAALLRRIRRPAPPAMVRTLSSLEKGKRRNYVVSASKEACLLAEYRLGPLQ